MSLLGRFHIIPYVTQRRINPLCRAQSRLLHSNLHKLEIGQSQIEQFRKDGFLIVPELISGDLATKLRSRIEPLFHGKFETGVYPDEWYWRPGMSLDNITREMCNAWKCDRSIASVVTSSQIGRYASELMNWPGAVRLLFDYDKWKPKVGKEIYFHQDSPYFDFIVPSEVITVWIALTPANTENGTLEYARGSHLWRAQSGMTQEFFTSKNDYQQAVKDAAKAANCNSFEVVPVVVPAGGGSFHHGATWHGSGANPSSEKERISLVIHLIRSDTVFKPSGVGYIYGRYKLHNSIKMEETFFPIVYTKDGYRSPTLQGYCEDSLL